VQEACEAIIQDWAKNGAAIRQASADPPPAPAAAKDPPLQSASGPPPIATAPAQSATAPPPAAAPAAPGGGKLSIASVPDGADIEVDGSFVGNAPSDLQLPDGYHTITVKKSGYRDWERTLKVSGGNNVHLNAELEKGTP